jgi:pimeloyl-ACP methyl ester carboxylesterase
MQAPLNYLNESDTRRASLAVVKYKAGGGKTPRSKVLGSVFFNPGGPGGSGVDWLRSLSNRGGGPLVSGSQFLDRLLESRYDIVAHDPRGVKTTWPRADCWQDETLKLVDDTLHLGADLYQASSGSLPRDVAHTRLMANVCKATIGDELQYVSTASTVRDLRLLYKAVGDKALNLIGVSYGTALGSYFAAMFPQEVGRFWLDAVVDVPDYQQGMWFDNLLDFEAVLSNFWSTCANAGPELCALSEALTTESDRASKDKGASVISKKFYEALESIRVQPVVVMDVDFPQLLTYLFIKGEGM